MEPPLPKLVFVVVDQISPKDLSMGQNLDVPGLFNFPSFLPASGHKKSGSPGAAKIVVVLHGTLIVQSGHGIEQGCQQIGSGIANLGAVVRDPLHDTGNVHGSYLGEPFLHIGGGVFRIPADPNGGARSASAWAGGGSFGIPDAL